MDALDFMKKVGNPEDFSKSMVEYFDQNMTMFNLVGHCEGINVSAVYDSASITYCLDKNQEKFPDLANAIKELSSCIPVICDRKFNIVVDDSDKDRITIKLKEETSR